MAGKIVGVIFSAADFQRATRMRHPPDLFELRLDALLAGVDRIESEIDRLPAPLIITARHPAEGGLNNLSAADRRKLLRRFLPHAAFIDIELRSAPALATVLETARQKRISTIASFHDFQGTPNAAKLGELLRAAKSLGADVFKIATTTNTPDQLATLCDFFAAHRSTMKIAAMGMGKLGRRARVGCGRHGSSLNYAHLGDSCIAGQLSVSQWRRALK